MRYIVISTCAKSRAGGKLGREARRCWLVVWREDKVNLQEIHWNMSQWNMDNFEWTTYVVKWKGRKVMLISDVEGGQGRPPGSSLDRFYWEKNELGTAFSKLWQVLGGKQCDTWGYSTVGYVERWGLEIWWRREWKRSIQLYLCCHHMKFSYG